MAVIFIAAVPLSSRPVFAAYVKRYTTIANGGMTYTGNSLGLSKQSSANAPGTSGAIGTFITTNTLSRDGTSWPLGTTSNWTANSASAPLRLPAGSTVLYAELIWGGSYNYGGQNVSTSLNTAVNFSGPFGSTSVSPSPATATVTGSGEYYYVRSADVTAYVRTGKTGTYTVAGVPGTEGTTENNANAAGWTLAVIYGNPSLPTRNMTIFVGAELTSSSVSTTSSVSGFCTPSSGAINARMMVSAIEGDSNLTGDQMQFGPTSATLSAVSGPNNPLSNFFCSQINKDDGTLDTAGTFGTANHTPGSNGSGKRQGWDITNIDVSARMQNSQNTAYARGTTSSDRYTITAIGLQINVGAPIFPNLVLAVDKPTTYIGDILTYSAVLDNTAGSANAVNTVYSDPLPWGTSFVPNSFKLDNVIQTGATPVTGVSIGTVFAGTVRLVSYQVKVEAIPLPPAPATYLGTATWIYEYESCPSFPINSSTITTNTTTTGTVRLQPTKSADPPGAVSPGGHATYKVTIPNTGTANSSGTTLLDQIPAGTSYVSGTTRLNGILVADAPGGAMPYTTAAMVNSPEEPAGQINIGASAVVTFEVEINPSPPLIITNTAWIDVDGPGPAPPISAVVTNPPVQADLSVTITDDKTTATAGTPISYTVTVTNNGPDTVISNILSIQLAAAISGVSYAPAAGSYNPTTGEWTGFTLASGQSIVLLVQGTLGPGAVEPLTSTATVEPSPGVEDSNMNNNTSSDTDTVNYIADLSITKDDGQTSVQPGMNLTYAIAVTNHGPSRVDELTVIDTLPPGIQNPVFTPSRGTYNETTGLWTGINLLPGQLITLTLTCTVDLSHSGNLINTATVSPSSGVTDPDLSNNTATDTNSGTALISLTKAVNFPTAPPGALLTYSILYRNGGGGGATSLIITDAVPAHTTYIPNSLKKCQGTCTYDAGSVFVTDQSADADGGQCDGNTVVFTIPLVSADDGALNAGTDEGIVFFKVKVQ